MRAVASALYSSLGLSTQKPDQTTPTSIALPTTEKSNATSILQNHPVYAEINAKVSAQFKEKILCLEILGIDSGRALALNPDLNSASLDSIHSILSFLESKGILPKDLPGMFGDCPQILTASINSQLIPVFDFLSDELKLTELNFRKVINLCPRLLMSSVRDQLKPALFYLKRLGFTDIYGLAIRHPVLFVLNVETALIPKLNYLVGLGFRREEVVQMVLSCPPLLSYSLENNYKPKLEYLLVEMKRQSKDLKEFPQYFSFSLENKIKPRHLAAVQSGVRVSLKLLLKSTDEEFSKLIRKGK